MQHTSVTSELSNFITKTAFDDIPLEIVEAGKTFILDWIAVTLGAVKEPSSRILIDSMAEIGGKEQASVLGYGFKTSTLNASFVNGTLSHTLDFDDAHDQTRNHTSVPILPVLMALGEYKGASGKDLITAYVIGFEASSRIGLAMGRGYYESGWHATSVLGRFGAVAGASRLLGLDRCQTARAMGLAATQAGGVRAVFGTMAKPFHAGKAAMDGLLSVLLCKRGFTAPENILDEEKGFFELFSSESDRNQLVFALGETYHILGNSLKPYAACLLTHPVIDGLISLKKQYGLSPESVAEIRLEVAPLNFKVTDNTDPGDSLEAKFSLQYCAVLGLSEGKVGHRQFSDHFLREPGMRALMGKVKVMVNESFKETQANVMVKTDAGKEYRKYVLAAKGDPKNPLTFDEVIAKFEDLASGVIPEEKIRRIIEKVEHLERVKQIGSILGLCRGQGLLEE